jgi:hypothetical protein
MEPRILNNKLKTRAAGLQALGIYVGSISAAGAITNAATGWTGGAPSSSAFTVTHNLALTADAYTVQATVTGASAGAAKVTTKATNTFVITTSDLATPTAADRAFDFLLIRSDGE